MQSKHIRCNTGTDIDRLFEQGVSDVSRAPRKTLSDEQIKAAATVSKSGAGIWLLSHAEEMLIGVVSFAAGCLVMIAVLHHTAPKPSGPQTSTIKTELQDHNDDNDIQNVSISTSNVSNPTSHVSNPMSHVKSPTSHVQSPTSQEPVVVKKTLIQRDTVVINETVILKDTVYVP